MERYLGILIGLTCLAISCQPDAKEKKDGMALREVPSFDGTTIHFEMAGTGDTALVFVHGWCIDGAYWNQQLDHFSSRFQTVSLDLAGHGQSANRKRHSMQAFGRDVKAVIELLDLKQVILVGHSMSEITVLETAIAMPDRVRGILGVDTFIDPTEVSSEEEKNRMLGAFAADFGGTVEAFIGESIAPETDSTTRSFILEDIKKGPPEVCMAVMEAIIAYSQSGAYLSQLKRLQVPIRTVNALPPNHEAWQTHYDNFGLIEISGVGHYPMLENGPLLNQKLEEALISLRQIPG